MIRLRLMQNLLRPMVGAALAVLATLTSATAQSAAPPAAQGSAPAPQGSQDGNLDDVLRTLNLKGKQAPAADFVVKTRPDADKLDYVPIGKQHPQRPVKTMTPAEVAAATADLDNARMAQQRRAGLKPVQVPDKAKKPGKPTPTPAAVLPLH